MRVNVNEETKRQNTYPFHYYCHVNHDKYYWYLSYSSLLIDLECLYLTKNVSIGYHHYELNDGNVVDDLKVYDDDQQDDLNRMDVEVVAEEVVVVVVVVESVLVELEDDDADDQDDETKQTVLIEMMIEAK